MLPRFVAVLVLTIVHASGALSIPTPTPSLAADATDRRPDRGGRHVLLISVDGLHASDLSRWVAEHPGSRLARLARVGTTFENASASEPSDSFPGLLAMVTGGTPRTTGVFYDDAYARDMWAARSSCTGAAGTETLYAGNLDLTVNGSVPLFTSIDPTFLPWPESTVGAHRFRRTASCSPIRSSRLPTRLVCAPPGLTSILLMTS